MNITHLKPLQISRFQSHSINNSNIRFINNSLKSDTVQFRGNIEEKEMSDEEFEILKKKVSIDVEYKALGVDCWRIKDRIEEIQSHITKYNIKLAKKLFSSPIKFSVAEEIVKNTYETYPKEKQIVVSNRIEELFDKQVDEYGLVMYSRCPDEMEKRLRKEYKYKNS